MLEYVRLRLLGCAYNNSTIGFEAKMDLWLHSLWVHSKYEERCRQSGIPDTTHLITRIVYLTATQR